MLLDEIESEQLHSNVSHSFTSSESINRTWSPRSLHFASKRSYQFSSEDPRLIDRVRKSVNVREIFNPFRTRTSSTSTDEVIPILS